ncbi:MAG: FecR domain-containing protein, partial [Chloroflexi bacterium]|nr:FecR domain-containing protein [Chloroflexota bacterium]
TPIAPTPTPVFTVETPSMTLEMLEGKAQYRVSDTATWQDAFSGQPVKQGWFVRTVAVSSAVLHFSDGSKVRISPNTQLAVELYQVIDGGPPKGERHARVRVLDGEIDFDVADAPSPPNTWVFITTDGAVTIQGTKGSLKRRVTLVTPAGEDAQAAIQVDLGITLLDGSATFAGLNPASAGDKHEVTAAVIKPGVDLSQNSTIPVPKSIAPSSSTLIKAAPEALGAGQAVDRDGNGKIDVIDLIFTEDLKIAVQRAGASLPDLHSLVAPRSSESAGPTPPQGASETARVLGELQVVAMGGESAVQGLKQDGNIDRARQRAIDAFSEKSRGGARALETFGLTEKAADAALANLAVKAFDASDTDPQKLLAGQTPADFIRHIANLVQPDELTGKKPDLDALIHQFDRRSEPPSAMPLFDAKGAVIGVKKPDEVVFDATGKPVGKKVGDIVAVDAQGNPTGAAVADTFFVPDPSGAQQFVPATVFAFLPKSDSTSDTGLASKVLVPQVTFDSSGNAVPTIYEVDDSGKPKGMRPLTKDMLSANGQAVAPPVIPNVLEMDPAGIVKNAKEIPLLARDDAGKVREFRLPSTMANDVNGKPVGLVDPGKVVFGENGIAGFEAGRVIDKEFFVGIAKQIAAQSAAGPVVGVPVPPASTVDQLFQQASKFAITGTAQQLFDPNGQPLTPQQFRPREIVRNVEPGGPSGEVFLPALGCIRVDCFATAAGKPALLDRIEEKIQVFAQGASGQPVLTEIQGHALFSDGKFAGFIPPPTALQVDQGGVTGFASGDIRVFAAAAAGGAGGPGGPGGAPPALATPGRTGGPVAAGFGVLIPNAGDLKFQPRGQPGQDISIQIDPSLFASAIPGGSAAGPAAGGTASPFFPPALSVGALGQNQSELAGLMKPQVAPFSGGAGAPPEFVLQFNPQLSAGTGVPDFVKPGDQIFQQIEDARRAQLEQG